MSRATKIWVVMDGGYLLGAFTVKHEMVSFGSRHGYANVGATVYEVPDGTSKVDTFKTYPFREVAE